VDEFAGVLNRHSACSDCHNPHTVNAGLPQQTAGGWTASGAQTGITGVNASIAWQNPINYEYELCLKCHSRYTVLLNSTTPTYNKTDKAGELDPTSASYHPIEAAGQNNTAEMQNSLNGGKLWQLTTGSTIRCTMCHGNYRLVGNPPTPNSPATTARLAPHSSKYRSLLIANYRDRDLKLSSEVYNSNDFTLCYLCHSEAPFATGSDLPRTDTNYRLHGMHLTGIAGQGGRPEHRHQQPERRPGQCDLLRMPLRDTWHEPCAVGRQPELLTGRELRAQRHTSSGEPDQRGPSPTEAAP
jgi:hypothetical protein